MSPALAKSFFARFGAHLLALVGGAGTFMAMANHRQLPHGVLIGGASFVLCVLGLSRALGLFGKSDSTEPELLSALGLRAGPRERALLAPLPAFGIGLLLVVLCALVLGARAVPLALLAAHALLLPAALSRPALLALLLCSALYLPLLGGYGLWDPWETHYGEVAREMLARDDWISLWWAQDGWFWSKPIYIFWTEALTWSASGIDYLPDSRFAHSEWVLRLPIYVVSMAALLAVQRTLASCASERAGVLAAIALGTTPYFGFLGRQAITDLPFVGLMTLAVMLLVRAFNEDPEREVTRYRVGRFSVSATELMLAVFLLVCLPQLVYLASRNITFIDGLFAWHRDSFLHGSGHNAGVPGNAELREQRPWARSIVLEPLGQALFFGVGAAFVVRLLRREKRAQSLYMFGFYQACALAFMAKGIPGFALPGLVAFLYLLTTGRFHLMFEGRLRIFAGGLLLLVSSLPWFVAMFVRHGTAFYKRIFIHDHLNRLTTGVHGDNGSIQYFIQQFGYGMFPWTVLLPVALAAFVQLRRSGPESVEAQRERELLTLLGMWFAAAFTLFSAMTTKFHHYIFPAVPPAALLVGIVLDRMLGREPASRASAAKVSVLAGLAPVPLVLGAAGLFGDVRGILPADLGMAQRSLWVLQHKWPLFVCVALIALGLVLLALALRMRAKALMEHDAPRGVWPALFAGAAVAAFVGRDLSWTTAERPAGYERLIHLFVYNYDRPWPEHFDYRPILSGFAVVAIVLCLLAALRALSDVMLRAFVGLAIAFSAWCLNVYMIDLSPHWSQQNLVERYYRDRKDPKHPLVAWQMNWKGENFYTGNRVAVFVNLNNKEVTSFMDDHKGLTAYFVLEHKRLDRFKRLLGKRKPIALSTERDNNKFVLLKAKL